MDFHKITVLGVGLMGASMAMGMRERSLCTEVTGYGRTEDNLRKAVSRGIIDSYEMDPYAAVDGADLVILATPVAEFIPLLTACAPSLKTGCIVIDLGSVKGSLVYALEKLMPEGCSYIACHPIAGSERSGINAASSELYEGAICVITPGGHSSPDALKRVTALWEALGARIESMSPQEHDRVYALLSHLPHLMAYALVKTVGDVDEELLRFAGRGFLDTTRVAASAPSLWRDICMHNRDNLIHDIDILRSNLAEIRDALHDQNSDAVLRIIERASSLRKGLA